MGKKILFFIALTILVSGTRTVHALSPEEQGIKHWFDVVTAANPGARYEAACTEGAAGMAMVDRLTDGAASGFSALGALLSFDFSRLEFTLLSSDGRTAYVRVSGYVGQPKSLLGGGKDWVPFGAGNRMRGLSDIAVSVYERGGWRHCDYLTLDQARQYIVAHPGIVPQAEDLQSEYDQARVTFSSEEISRIAGVWRGWYTCDHGKTGLAIEIQRLPDGGLGGRSKFFPIAENPGAPSGAIEVRILVGQTHIFIEPIRWLNKPRNLHMVGMAGIMNQSGTLLRGKMLSSECGEFVISRNE